MADKLIPANMPAGHAKDEAKKIVTDQLAEEMEAKEATAGAYDPNDLEIDNEIARNYNPMLGGFEVIGALPDYHYVWVRDDMRSVNELLTRASRYLGTRVPGYQIVRGKDPECRNMLDAQSYRRNGDTILAKAPIETKEAIDACIDRQNRAREMGIAEGLLEAAERNPKYVRAYAVEGDPHDIFRDRARRGGADPARYEQEMLASMAIHNIGEDAKTGNIKGLPLGRAIGRR